MRGELEEKQEERFKKEGKKKDRDRQKWVICSEGNLLAVGKC